MVHACFLNESLLDESCFEVFRVEFLLVVSGDRNVGDLSGDRIDGDLSGDLDGDLSSIVFMLSNTIVMGTFPESLFVPDVLTRRFGAVDSEFITADIFLALTVMMARLPPRPDGPPVVCGLLPTFPGCLGESAPCRSMLLPRVVIGELLSVCFSGLFLLRVCII